MIKIYGMPTCPYCDYVHEQVTVYKKHVHLENDYEGRAGR